MRRYKKREVAECQTVIQCTPFILHKGECAIVVSNQNTQTVATCAPDCNDIDFYPQLMRVNPEDIQLNSINQVGNSKLLTFELPYEEIAVDNYLKNENDQTESISSPSEKFTIVRNPSIQVDEREGYDEKMIQTRLMVFPYFLRDNENAIVSTDICTQTSVSCEPQTSLTEIIPKLKTFLEHDGHDVEDNGDTVANRSILDIILEIIKDVEDTHKQWFDNKFLMDIPSELQYLHNVCAICQDKSLPLNDQSRIDMCEAPCHPTPSEPILPKVLATVGVQVEEDIFLKEPSVEVIDLLPVNEISEDTSEHSEIENELSEEVSSANVSLEEEISVEQEDKSLIGSNDLENVTDEETLDDKESDRSEDIDSTKTKCQNCVCSNLKIRLYINNLGLPENFPSKNICLELNILREMQNIQITAISDEYEDEEIEDDVTCDPTCCINKNQISTGTFQNKIPLPDGRSTTCPVIVSKLTKDGYKYFCQEDETEEIMTEPDIDEQEADPTKLVETIIEEIFSIAETINTEPEIESEVEAQVDEPTESEVEAQIDEPAEFEAQIDEPAESEAQIDEPAESEEQTASEAAAEPIEPETQTEEPIISESEIAETENQDVSLAEDQPSEADSSERVYCMECSEDETTEQEDDMSDKPLETEVITPEFSPSSTNEQPPCHCDDITEALTSDAEQIDDDKAEELTSDAEEIDNIKTEDVEENETVDNIEGTIENEDEQTEEVVVEENAEQLTDENEPVEENEELEIIEEEEKEEDEKEEDEKEEEKEEEEQEMKDFILPFCEKKIIRKKRSRHVLESRAMSINNLMDGKIMALISKYHEGFEVVLNIKSTLPPSEDECKCDESDDKEEPANQIENGNNAYGDDIYPTKTTDHPCNCNPTTPTNICDCDNIVEKSCCSPVKLDISDDEYETCSEGPSTSRSKKPPEIMQPIPEVNTTVLGPSTNAQLVLPDSTVLNLMLSLDMKNYDQICSCRKKRDGKLHRYNQPHHKANTSTEKVASKFIKDVNSLLFTDSSKTLNIVQSADSDNTYISGKSSADTNLFPNFFNVRDSGELKYRKSHPGNNNNGNCCTKQTCERLKKRKIPSQSESKSNEISDTQNILETSKLESSSEKQDAVFMAFKACEVELKPVITALTNIRQELKSLNMPEIDSIFKKTDTFTNIPSKTILQKKIADLNKQEDIYCKLNLKLHPTIIKISEDTNKMKTTTKLKFNYVDSNSLPIPQVIPQHDISKSSTLSNQQALYRKTPSTARESNMNIKNHRSYCKYVQPQCIINEERKSSTPKLNLSLLPSSKTTQSSFKSTACEYSNSNYSNHTNSFLKPLKDISTSKYDLPFYNSQISTCNSSNSYIYNSKSLSKSSDNTNRNCNPSNCKSRTEQFKDESQSNTNSYQYSTKNKQSCNFQYLNSQFNSTTTTSAILRSSTCCSRTKNISNSNNSLNICNQKQICSSDRSKIDRYHSNSTYNSTQYEYDSSLKSVKNCKCSKNSTSRCCGKNCRYKLKSQTNPTLAVASNSPSITSVKQSESDNKISTPLLSTSTVESFNNQDGSSSSKSNISCVLSEEFICPSDRCCNINCENKQKRSNNSSGSNCPFLKIIESISTDTYSKQGSHTKSGCKKCRKY